eukprot:XP_001700908.1 predicted protein [Chlamydomonas reinhardtii]
MPPARLAQAGTAAPVSAPAAQHITTTGADTHRVYACVVNVIIYAWLQFEGARQHCGLLPAAAADTRTGGGAGGSSPGLVALLVTGVVNALLVPAVTIVQGPNFSWSLELALEGQAHERPQASAKCTMVGGGGGGGRLSVSLTAKGMGLPGVWPDLSVTAVSMSARSPAFSLDATLHTCLPYLQQLREADTHTQSLCNTCTHATGSIAMSGVRINSLELVTTRGLTGSAAIDGATGTVAVYGGTSGPATVDFSLSGRDWRWGAGSGSGSNAAGAAAAPGSGAAGSGASGSASGSGSGSGSGVSGGVRLFDRLVAASVRLRVEDGAIGGALLGRAQASLVVDPQQRLHFDGTTLHARSLEATIGKTGHVRVHGSLPDAAAGGAGGSSGAAAPAPPLTLAGLEVVLGPDLRAVFPVVLNLGLSGAVSLSGPADPDRLTPVGVVSLDSGTLNLLATQLLRRPPPEPFSEPFPEPFLEPFPERHCGFSHIALVSGDLRAAIQSIGDAARILEERLADALLGEKGQLALRSLARSTVSSLLPRIETRGQASLSHKLGQDLGRGGGELPGGGGGTEARLSLQLSDRVRLQAHLARGALIPSVTLQCPFPFARTQPEGQKTQALESRVTSGAEGEELPRVSDFLQEAAAVAAGQEQTATAGAAAAGAGRSGQAASAVPQSAYGWRALAASTAMRLLEAGGLLPGKQVVNTNKLGTRGVALTPLSPGGQHVQVRYDSGRDFRLQSLTLARELEIRQKLEEAETHSPKHARPRIAP